MGEVSIWYVKMIYGDPFCRIKLNDHTYKSLKLFLSRYDNQLDTGELHGSTGEYQNFKTRKSRVAWIEDREIRSMFLKLCHEVNRQAKWNFNIVDVEPLQYSWYQKDDHYGWHIDTHPQETNKLIRKISCTINLNDPSEYEGGELDLDLYKPGFDPRWESMTKEEGNAIFFNSSTWHRVRPITSGTRKSLVAWFVGNPYV